MSEKYDDIEKLLSHESLGGFAYQSFKKPPTLAPIVQSPAPEMTTVADPEPASVSKPSFVLPELGRPEGRQLRLVASKPQSTELPVVRSVTTPQPASGEVDKLFQRLTRVAPERPLPSPVLDLNLPERPLLPRDMIAANELITLCPRDAFARLLGQPRFVEALTA